MCRAKRHDEGEGAATPVSRDASPYKRYQRPARLPPQSLLLSAPARGSGRGRLRSDADIGVLMVHVVRGEGLVLVVLEYAHDLGQHVAVGIERDQALQGLDL